MTGRKSCPICRKPVSARYRPFCSRRCADVDLGRWFAGAYAVPGETIGTADDDDDPQPAEPGRGGSEERGKEG